MGLVATRQIGRYVVATAAAATAATDATITVNTLGENK